MRTNGPSDEKGWQYHNWAYRQILDIYGCEDHIDLQLLQAKHSANLFILDIPKIQRTTEQNNRLDRARKFFNTIRNMMNKANELVAMSEQDRPEVKDSTQWPKEDK